MPSKPCHAGEGEVRRVQPRWSRLCRLINVSVVLVLMACTSEDPADMDALTADGVSAEDGHIEEDSTPEARGVFDELRDQGIDLYFGMATYEETTLRGGITQRDYDVGSGPVCLYGAAYQSLFFPSERDELLIFLNGGGACWSEFCLATWTPDSSLSFPGIEGDCGEDKQECFDALSFTGITSPDAETNPFRDWGMLVLPYCDGSLYLGDAATDTDGDGEIDRSQRGLANLTAGLEHARDKHPNPSRIVLAGSSGGGFGTIPASILTRFIWPDVPIDVINDSGIGVAKDGDADFIETLKEDWQPTAFVPESCEDCMSDGHLFDMLRWQLERDPNMRMGAFSTENDLIIGTLFLQLGSGEFGAQVLTQTQAMAAQFPGRYVPFLAPGSAHTVLKLRNNLTIEADEAFLPFPLSLGGYEDVEVNGVTVLDWMQQMLDPEATWEAVYGFE